MRNGALILAAVTCGTASPAAAQIFWQSPPVAGSPLTPGEIGIGVALPGATPVEERAHWLWQLRSGLNVAALQCDFDPTLLSKDSYNGVLNNHKDELAAAYETLRKYFVRNNKAPRAAQNALDVYGTRTYSGFSTVRSQFGFCHAASRVGRDAQFASRGSLTLFAVDRLRELRNALAPAGEQFFRFGRPNVQVAYPSFDDKCWDRRGNYRGKCGVVYS